MEGAKSLADLHLDYNNDCIKSNDVDVFTNFNNNFDYTTKKDMWLVQLLQQPYGIFLYAVQNKSITDIFLNTGHIQNDGDYVHTVIENLTKRAVNSAPILSCTGYIRLKCSSKSQEIHIK